MGRTLTGYSYSFSRGTGEAQSGYSSIAVQGVGGEAHAYISSNTFRGGLSGIYWPADTSNISRVRLRLLIYQEGNSTPYLTSSYYTITVGAASVGTGVVTISPDAEDMYSTFGTSVTFEFVIELEVTLNSTTYTSTATPITVRFTVSRSSVYTYTMSLVYNANGGSGAPSTQNYSGSSSSNTFTVSTTEPTREGYTFLGWSTSSTSSVVEYEGGDSISISWSTDTVTLYAVWEEDSGDFDNTYIKINQEWQQTKEVYIKINGEWVLAQRVYIKINTEWN